MTGYLDCGMGAAYVFMASTETAQGKMECKWHTMYLHYGKYKLTGGRGKYYTFINRNVIV